MLNSLGLCFFFTALQSWHLTFLYLRRRRDAHALTISELLRILNAPGWWLAINTDSAFREKYPYCVCAHALEMTLDDLWMMDSPTTLEAAADAPPLGRHGGPAADDSAAAPPLGALRALADAAAAPTLGPHGALAD
jgi:hypothetical protein